MKIEIGDKEYNVKEAKSIEERRDGLQNVKELPQDEGMIFYFDTPQNVEMWMRDTLIPLDIIFINEDQEVIAVEQGKPNDDTLLDHNNTMYVVEDITGTHTDPYHYKLYFHTEIIPDVEFKP